MPATRCVHPDRSPLRLGPLRPCPHTLTFPHSPLPRAHLSEEGQEGEDHSGWPKPQPSAPAQLRARPPPLTFKAGFRRGREQGGRLA